MAEYIEREAAIAAAFTASAIGNSAYRDVNDTVNRLRLIPAADVQPVIRCKNCLHSKENGFICTHPSGLKYAFPNSFCSCGMRMDGGEE